MWKYPFAGENPFNVCAEEICHLRLLDQRLFNSPEDRDTTSSPKDLKEEVDALFALLPIMSDTSKLLRGVPVEEKERLHGWKYYNDFAYLLEFLSRYTLKLSYEKVLGSPYLYSMTHGRDGVEFESLNDNSEETGILILPLVPTINDPLDPAAEGMSHESEDATTGKPPEKHWASDRVPGIQGELSNIFYVEKEKLETSNGGYRVKNSILQRGIFAEGKKQWKTAACPIAHKELVAVQLEIREGEDREQNFFAVAGLKDKEFIYERIKAAFIEAADLGADVIIFPEMLGDEHILSRNFFREIAQLLQSFGYPMPELILLPTWWHDGRNELHVFDGSGKRLCVQQKQYPYVYESPQGQKFKENLIDPERVIHVVHIPGVGRFAFPICKDLLEQEYRDLLLRQLRVTFLLCPSYSQHKAQFQMEAISGNKYGCYTIWHNTCAAYWRMRELPKQIGLIAGPQADLTKTMECMTPECQGVCGKEKDSCIFLVEITMDHSANISWQHVKQ